MSYKLQGENLKVRVDIQKPSLYPRAMRSNPRLTSLFPRVMSSNPHKLRVQILKLRVQVHDVRVQIHEFKDH